jgi:hypothetical protein
MKKYQQGQKYGLLSSFMSPYMVHKKYCTQKDKIKSKIKLEKYNIINMK